MKHIFFFILFLSFSFIQADNLSDWISAALKNNPSLQAEQKKLESLQKAAALNRISPAPELNYTYSLQADNDFKPLSPKISVSKLFPAGSKLSSAQKYEMIDTEIQVEKIRSLRISLALKLKLYYADYFYLGRQIDILNETISLMQQLESTAQSKYSASKAPFSNVIKIQVEISRLEDRLTSLKELEETLISKIEALTASDISHKFPVSLLKIPPADELTTIFLAAKNPEVRISELTAQKEALFRDTLKNSLKTDLKASLEYDVADNDFSNNPAVIKIAMIFPQKNKKYSYKLQQSIDKENAANLSRKNSLNTIQASLKTALFEQDDYARKIQLYRDTLIPQTKQLLSVSENGYVAGTDSFADIVDTEKTLLELKLAYENARAMEMKKYAEACSYAGIE